MCDTNIAFEFQITEAVRNCIGLGYNPTIFKGMVETHGAVATAEKLVASSDPANRIKAS